MNTFEELKDAIITANSHKVNELLPMLEDEPNTDTLYEDCISPALGQLCTNIKARKGAIPELLLSLRQVHRVVDSVGDKAQSNRSQRLVMGVVEGDIHDMGKNVVRDLCKGYGFEVADLGKNVSPDDFVQAALNQQSDIACLSTMMSTTLGAMETTIKELKSKCPGIQVLIGGAFINNEIAQQLNADGYAKDASIVVEEIERMLQ